MGQAWSKMATAQASVRTHVMSYIRRDWVHTGWAGYYHIISTFCSPRGHPMLTRGGQGEVRPGT